MKKILIVGLLIQSSFGCASDISIETLTALQNEIKTGFESVKNADVSIQNNWIKDRNDNIAMLNNFENQREKEFDDLYSKWRTLDVAQRDLKKTIADQYHTLNPRIKYRRYAYDILPTVITMTGMAVSCMKMHEELHHIDNQLEDKYKTFAVVLLKCLSPAIIAGLVTLKAEMYFYEPNDQKMPEIVESDTTK